MANILMSRQCDQRGKPGDGRLDSRRVTEMSLTNAVRLNVAACGLVLAQGVLAGPTVPRAGEVQVHHPVSLVVADSASFESGFQPQRDLVALLPLVSAEGQPVAQAQAGKEGEGRPGDRVAAPAEKQCEGVHFVLRLMLFGGMAWLGVMCSPIIGSKYDVDLGDLWRRVRGRKPAKEAA